MKVIVIKKDDIPCIVVYSNGKKERKYKIKPNKDGTKIQLV